MASESENLNGKLEVNDNQLANIDLKENRKLRDAGLEYVSRTGKTIAAKVQPDELCNCPQKCGEKIPDEVRKYLFTEFYKMGDHITQNAFLQNYIEMRSVRKRLWDDDEQRVGGRLQRRVSCKYHIPTEILKDENKPVDKTSPSDTNVRKTNPKQAVPTVEVCQKAFMNTYAITEKRIRLQREKLISKSRKDAGMGSPNSKDSSQFTNDLTAELAPLLMSREILANISSFENNALPSHIPNKILLAIDNDISIVNNFFCNQLWKPLYVDFDDDDEDDKSTTNTNNFLNQLLKPDYVDVEFDKSTSLSKIKDDYPKLIPLKPKTNGDSFINGISNSITENSVVTSTPKTYGNKILNLSSNKKLIKDFSLSKVSKNRNSNYSITTSTPKNISVNNSSKRSSNGSLTPTPTKYMSFENSSISITPVNSKSGSNNSSSSIYNNINFGNSSISITPLYRQ